MIDNQDVEWEPVPLAGFSDYDWCESLSVVRSRRRAIARILFPSNSRNRKQWCLRDIQGKAHTVYEHQLVCAKHHGPKPDGMEVCHNDGDVTNNTPDNLRWDSHRNNMLDAHTHGTYYNMRGELHWGARLTEEQALEIRRDKKSLLRELAGRFGISVQQVSRIRKGLQWAYAGGGGERT